MIGGLQSKINSKLTANILSMMSLQAVNLILPLLIIPFVVDIFGIEKFGLLAFASAICMFANVICDYGFNLTATRDIAININNHDDINGIFSSVIAAKLLLVLLTFIIFTIVIFSFDRFQQDWHIYILTFGLVIGNAILPLWLYQGMKNFKFVSLINIGFKVFFTLLIFILVEHESDLYKVPLLLSLGYLVPGIFAFLYAIRKYQLKITTPNLLLLKSCYISGWHVFISRLAVFSYTSMNIIFLELFTNNAVVGYFAIANRVVSAISSIVGMVSQTIFPYLSAVWVKNKQLYYKQLSFASIAISSVMVVIAMALYMLAPFIIIFLSGSESLESINALRILCLALIFYPLGGLFTQSFITQQRNEIVTNVTFKTMVVNFILVCALTPIYGIYGLVIAVCLVQLFQVIINLKYIKKLRNDSLCVV